VVSRLGSTAIAVGGGQSFDQIRHEPDLPAFRNPEEIQVALRASRSSSFAPPRITR
jgi:hypothetical protein